MLTNFRNNCSQTILQSLRAFSTESSLYEVKFPHNYNSKEETDILNVLNTAEIDGLNRFAVSGARCKKLLTHRKKHGEFKDLHQVLAVEGFGIKVLRSLCHSILHPPPEELSQPKKPRPLNYVIPELTLQRCESIQRVVGLNLGTLSISWAGIDVANSSLYNWGNHQLILSPEVKRHHETKLLEASYDAFQKIPEADTYVMESCVTGGATQQSASVPVNQQRLQLSSMLLVLLNQAARERNGEQCVIFQRTSLWCRLYGTLVGGERVSCQSVAEDLLGGSPGPWTPLSCPNEHLKRYYDESAVAREAMSAALLLTTSFLDVNVRGLTSCWHLLRGRPAKASKSTPKT